MSKVRTNVVLDEPLVRRAMKILGAKSKREAIHTALKKAVELGAVYSKALASGGKLTWEGELRREARIRA
ncbi:MAG: hypothetical protein A3G34_12295 [Candidatus Lindowbacteria bacterium RIFCSPLOWO2_12_FULL_62_27]|nr:MAG: hypothetical protein A3I06_11965 [Candidatus Lindowbacteria bacterium RIFCSPLOWO2_02_FULL_62_12]OGH62379.1 MAG: hypothetical protein A3G34_12295 [Candidatus Lindowbacteria bacterium RIFCSPLOWO2_12_FULL_62_27]